MSLRDVQRTHTYASDKLRANLLLKQYQLEVDLRHMGLYNDELAHAIQDRPAEILPLVSNNLGIGVKLALIVAVVRDCGH